MPRISEIDPKTAPESIQKIIADHVADGHALTAEKRTLLHNAAAFNAVEAGSYALDDELQRLIGKRAADFYEYAISQKNGCLVCSIYFQNLLKKNGIDFDTFEFTPKEQVLIEYGQAIAEDPKHVPEELFAKLKADFTEEEIVVITAMGVMMQRYSGCDAGQAGLNFCTSGSWSRPVRCRHFRQWSHRRCSW